MTDSHARRAKDAPAQETADRERGPSTPPTGAAEEACARGRGSSSSVSRSAASADQPDAPVGAQPQQGKEPRHGSLGRMTTAELLDELGRRFRVRFGRVEVVFHDGRPSPRVTVEYRVLRGSDD